MQAANPHAQKEVIAVLDYFEQNKGSKVVLGQHTQTMGQEELSYIQNVTGKLPALCGFELLAYSPNIDYVNSDEECLIEVRGAEGTLTKAWEWARKGGLLTFTWHWFSPLGGCGKSFFSKCTDFDAAKAVTPGTDENKAMMSDMDYMAGLLRPFCDAHVPILWRPFHESEGDWFWWGYKDKTIVVKLYEIMFDRFVNHFHLDNLIWVYNSPDARCYPGDEFVDIVTRDMYPPAHEHTARSESYEQLATFTDNGHIYAIAETGTLPDVDAIAEQRVPWSYYMTWSLEFCMSEQYTDNEQLKKTYDSKCAVTLDKLPRLYTVRE